MGVSVQPHKERKMSATVEPCYCESEVTVLQGETWSAVKGCGGSQLEVYELDVDQRLTAKFGGVTFHMTREAAEAEALKINGGAVHLGRKKSSAETEPEGVQTVEGDTTMAKFEATKEKPLSNKKKVFNAFISGETNREKLNKLTKNAIKDNVLRGWMAGWLRGSDPGYPKLNRATKALIEKNKAQA